MRNHCGFIMTPATWVSSKMKLFTQKKQNIQMNNDTAENKIK